MRSLPLSVLLVVALPALAGCGGHDDEANTTKTTPTALQLDGIYKPSDANGAIASITFAGGVSYLLMPNGCTTRACAEIGKYRIDEEAQTLWLGTRSMPLAVVASTPSKAAVVKQSLRITDLVNPDQQLDNGVVAQLIETITQMFIDGQELNRWREIQAADCRLGPPNGGYGPMNDEDYEYWARCGSTGFTEPAGR